MDIDSKNTPYRTSIKRLFSSLGIIPTRKKDFKCRYYKQCSKPKRTGDWGYVGVDYGSAKISGKKAKILFVAMDRGGHAKGYSKKQLFEDAQGGWHGATEKPGNAHMGGVHLIVKELVKENTKDPSIFANQLALTNSVKCGKYTKKMRSTSTEVMTVNCSNHLLKEINCLKPDLIITQGNFPKWRVRDRLGLSETSPTYQFKSREGRVAEIYRLEHRLVLTTPHPARLKGMKWKEGKLPPFLYKAIQKVKEII